MHGRTAARKRRKKREMIFLGKRVMKMIFWSCCLGTHIYNNNHDNNNNDNNNTNTNTNTNTNNNNQ